MQVLPTILPPPPLPDGTEAPPRSTERHGNLVRFQSELEFVQCLAHPQYLHELHIQGYLFKPEFLNYLRYLEYWRSPEYVRSIIYPTCLVYLTLLQTELFRSRLGDIGFITELMRVGSQHYATWRSEKPKAEDKPDVMALPNGGEHDEDKDDGDDGEAEGGGRGKRKKKRGGKGRAGNE